jgi:hypothetical protein
MQLSIVARQRLRKNLPMTTNIHVKREGMLDSYFSMHTLLQQMNVQQDKVAPGIKLTTHKTVSRIRKRGSIHAYLFNQRYNFSLLFYQKFLFFVSKG